MDDKKKPYTEVSEKRKKRIDNHFKKELSKSRSKAAKKWRAEAKKDAENAKEVARDMIYKSLEKKLLAGPPFKLTKQERELLKVQQKVLKAERDKRLKGNNLVRFCPNGAQENVVGLIKECQKDIKTPQIVAWFAGNGVGKTACLINILGNIVFKPQPFIIDAGTLDEYIDPNSPVNWVKEWGDPPEGWFNHEILDKWPYPKDIRIISTPANLDDNGAIQLEIDKWWPKNQFQVYKGKYDYRSKITTNMGFVIEFKTYDQNVTEHESKTCGMILADEPIPQSLWGPTVSRLRRGGILLMGMTPLFGSAFLYDEVVQKADSDPTVKYIFSDVEMNCTEHGVRGVLTHQAIEWMISRYPREERESRKKGTFLSLSGKIHKDFERDIHILKPRLGKEKIPSRDFIMANKHLFQFYQVVDPHDRKWDAIGYYALDDWNRKYTIDEYPDRSQRPYNQLVTRMHNYEQLIKNVLIPKEEAMGFKRRDLTRIMDPRYAHNRSERGVQKTGLTIEEEWSIYYNDGFITNITDNFTVGRNKLDNNLMIGNDGYPFLFFYEGYAENHIYAIEHWMWDRWEGKTAEKRDVKEKPQERNSDFPRLLHYLCTFDPAFTNKSPQQIGWRDKLKGQRKHIIRGDASWMGR